MIIRLLVHDVIWITEFPRQLILQLGILLTKNFINPAALSDNIYSAGFVVVSGEYSIIDLSSVFYFQVMFFCFYL